MTGILDRVEASLADFRPRNHREFVALQVARRFNDTYNLAKYLLEAPHFPKRQLLEAARLAEFQAGGGTAGADRYFELLAQFRKEAE